jgi:hypothetical protein
MTPLHVSSYFGSEKVLKKLIKYGAAIHLRDHVLPASYLLLCFLLTTFPCFPPPASCLEMLSTTRVLVAMSLLPVSCLPLMLIQTPSMWFVPPIAPLLSLSLFDWIVSNRTPFFTSLPPQEEFQSLLHSSLLELRLRLPTRSVFPLSFALSCRTALVWQNSSACRM